MTYVCILSLAGFFKDLLAASKRGFHEMFKKTYGMIYEQNAYVFTDFFKELENYYAKGTVSTSLSFLLPWNLIISTLKWRNYDLLFAENSIYKIGSRSIKAESVQSLLKGTLLSRTVLPILLPENLELWCP